MLARFRRVNGADEPSTRELLELVDGGSSRLVVDSEFSGSCEETASRVFCGMLDAVGLFNRRTRQTTISVAELREIVAFEKWKGPPPRGPISGRDVVTSFDGFVLGLWFRNKLSTVDFPDNPHPVVSALFLGRPLRSILLYYLRWGMPLSKGFISEETRLYLSLLRHWERSVSHPSRNVRNPSLTLGTEVTGRRHPIPNGRGSKGAINSNVESRSTSAEPIWVGAPGS